MAVNLRKVVSASALRSSSSPRMVSAISLASTRPSRGKNRQPTFADSKAGSSPMRLRPTYLQRRPGGGRCAAAPGAEWELLVIVGRVAVSRRSVIGLWRAIIRRRWGVVVVTLLRIIIVGRRCSIKRRRCRDDRRAGDDPAQDAETNRGPRARTVGTSRRWHCGQHNRGEHARNRDPAAELLDVGYHQGLRIGWGDWPGVHLLGRHDALQLGRSQRGCASAVGTLKASSRY